MGERSCERVTVRDFLAMARVQKQNIRVASDDKYIDNSDNFVLRDADGRRERLKYDDERIQAIIARSKERCVAEFTRASERDEITRHFKVSFGRPKLKLKPRCRCERIGVYRKGKHLFDLTEQVRHFSSKGLAHQLSARLKKPVPEKYRESPQTQEGPKEPR